MDTVVPLQWHCAREHVSTLSSGNRLFRPNAIFDCLLQCVLQKASNWRFNAFTLETVTGGKQLKKEKKRKKKRSSLVSWLVEPRHREHVKFESDRRKLEVRQLFFQKIKLIIEWSKLVEDIYARTESFIASIESLIRSMLCRNCMLLIEFFKPSQSVCLK